MILLNPKADIPVVQLSVLESEDPHQHFLMGRALATLRESNVAIIGSGFASFHNIRLIFSRSVSKTDLKARQDEWNETLTAAVSEQKQEAREKRLNRWREFPHAYEMHPPHGPEHFLPLLVCAGAAGDGGCSSYRDTFMGSDAWTYYWT